MEERVYHPQTGQVIAQGGTQRSAPTHGYTWNPTPPPILTMSHSKTSAPTSCRWMDRCPKTSWLGTGMSGASPPTSMAVATVDRYRRTLWCSKTSGLCVARRNNL